MSHRFSYRPPSLFSLCAEAVQGKSVSRTLTNLFWNGLPEIAGSVLDIGGGGPRGSHYRFLPIVKDAVIQTVDVVRRPGTDFVLDISTERVPLPDGSQDYVFLFNLLEHVNAPAAVLAEAHRLLRAGGKLLGTVPFLINVHPDPHDYARFSGEALRELFAQSGYAIEALEPIGRGPFLAAYEQLDMLLWSPAHLAFVPLVWGLDALLALMKPSIDFRARFPLAYNFVVRK